MRPMELIEPALAVPMYLKILSLFIQTKIINFSTKINVRRPYDHCHEKIKSILKKITKKLEMSQMIENKAFSMVEEMILEHDETGYDTMERVEYPKIEARSKDFMLSKDVIETQNNSISDFTLKTKSDDQTPPLF